MAGRYGAFNGGGQSLQMQTGLGGSTTSSATPTSNFATYPTGSIGGNSVSQAPNYNGGYGFSESGNGISQATNYQGGYAGMLGVADGGVIPNSPTGTTSPDLDTALATVQGALASGRQSMGLPANLMGDSDQSSQGDDNSDQQVAGTIPARPANPGGDQPNSNPFPTKTPQIPFGKRTADASGAIPEDNAVMGLAGGGDMDDPSTAKLDAPAFAGGGDMNDPSAAGIPAQPQANMPQPQQGQTQPANDPMQALTQYASGAGAVPPEMAAALEQRVDPTGSMDPSQRKLLAVASAPQQAQFGMLQHYRQRFQAMNSFARVAANGTQGRPANLAASTDAATRAYHNVPNGQSISFHPAGPGHVAMTVSHYAGDKGASKKVTAHAAGGAVPDDVDPMDVGPEGAVSSGEPNDLGQTMDTATAQVGAIPADTSILGNGMGEAETAATPKVALLSTSQYLNMLKNGHFDQMMDDAEKAAKCGKCGESKPGDAFPEFLVLWALIPILFFSLSKSKLPGYILPVFPALAVIIGQWINDLWTAPNAVFRARWALWIFSGFSAAICSSVIASKH